MEIILLYTLLTSASFYLGSRAVITSWIWGRYPRWFARFMDCAACSGAWYGFAVGELAVREILPLPRFLPAHEYTPLIIGLCSIVWTPIVAGFMQLGFERLGSAVPEEEEAQGGGEGKT